MRAFGRLDAAILNAGVGLPDPSFRDAVAATADDHPSSLAQAGQWRMMLDINLGAVVEGAWLAVRHMRGHGHGGTILINASAAGLFPGPGLEAYAASKAGAVQLARSLGWMHQAAGIRVVAVCPQFTHTPLVSSASERRPPLPPSSSPVKCPKARLGDTHDGLTEDVVGAMGFRRWGRRWAWAKSWMSS